MKKYSKYIIFGVGFLITLLLTIAIVYLNKNVFSTNEFKAIKDSSDIKLVANNLIGFSEMIVVFSTFVLFLKENNNE